MNNKEEKDIAEELKTKLFHDKELELDIKYTLLSNSKNFIFYKCSKRPKCKGRAKLNLKTNELEIIEKCNMEIIHENIKFDDFQKRYRTKNFENINFENKKYHRYYIKAMIKAEDFIDIPKAIQSFKKDTGKMLLLKREEINILKSQITDNYNNLDLLELINHLNDSSYELEIKTTDIKYNYKKKNKTEESKEQLTL